MRLIPAIDILGGKCVRLTRGEYDSATVYDGSPLDMARRFEDHGFSFLHLVDLDGAREKHVVNYRVLEKVAGNTSLKIDFGGGIKSEEDIRIAFECGAWQVNIGTLAATDRQLFLSWLSSYGPEKIILGADSAGNKIMVSGWEEGTNLDIIEYIRAYRECGVKYVVCTEISRDGMLTGPATDLYKRILETADVSLIASGGISSLADLEMLISTGCEGAIIGKAIYEGKIQLKELAKLC
jgi:phosphoribosylformimino-5-aminoimidazole carboxamide ribotide isomerase